MRTKKSQWQISRMYNMDDILNTKEEPLRSYIQTVKQATYLIGICVPFKRSMNV
jgi:hypothetical protein